MTTQTSAKNWFFNIMMIIALLMAFVIVPLGFIFSNQFTRLLRAAGVTTAANFTGGTLIAEFPGPWRDFGNMTANTLPALAIQKIAFKSVRFHPLSGVGIAPRLNIVLEYGGKLPNPHNSAHLFSQTTIHIYLKYPGPAQRHSASANAAHVDFAPPGWDWQISADGLREKADIIDNQGKRLADGAEISACYIYAAQKDDSKEPAIEKTQITIAVPIAKLGHTPAGEWSVYFLTGIMDSRNQSLLAEEAGVSAPCRTLQPAKDAPAQPANMLRPVLYPVTIHLGAL